MFAGKPIIGIAGGIGSGKTFVAQILAELGCLVISSDDQVRQAYLEPSVREALRKWWGPEVFGEGGEINRSAIARKIFDNPPERERLEHLLHPLVARARDELMLAHADNSQVLAFVWDTPLLFETGLDRKCDATVYVDAPEDVRLERVRRSRGWNAAEVKSREKLQLPLDRKREMSDHVVSNTAGADDASGANQVRVQVREVLSRILAGLTPMTGSH